MSVVETVKELKRTGRHEEALPLLWEWIQDEEGSSGDGGVAPWPYEQVAIIYRKMRQLEEEAAVLERFAQQRHAPGAKPPKLLDRLVRVYELLGQLEEVPYHGEVVQWHREQDQPVDALPAFVQQGLVVDTETTGLSRDDEVIELGAILFAFSRYSGRVLKELDRYHGFREPARPISWGAARKHGLTVDKLVGFDLDYTRLAHLFYQAQLVIAHNASFDFRFVSGLVPNARETPWHCSMRGCSWKKWGFPSAKLDDLLEACEIERVREHRALDDAEALLTLLARPGYDAPDGTCLLQVVSKPPVPMREAPAPQELAASTGEAGSRPGCAAAVVAVVTGLGLWLLWP